MTDKVQKIREEVEIVINRRLNLLNGDYFDLNKEADGFTNEIMDTINLSQEEPVSIWHNASEIPQEGSLILREIGISQKGYGVIRYSKELPNFPKHCEDIPIQKWAYIDDILNLSNVERTVKDWKEEPVSEDFDSWYEKEWVPFRHSSYTTKDKLEEAFKAGANWQKEQMMANAFDVTITGIREYEEENEADFTLMLEKGTIPYKLEEDIKVIIIKED